MDLLGKAESGTSSEATAGHSSSRFDPTAEDSALEPLKDSAMRFVYKHFDQSFDKLLPKIHPFRDGLRRIAQQYTVEDGSEPEMPDDFDETKFPDFIQYPSAELMFAHTRREEERRERGAEEEFSQFSEFSKPQSETNGSAPTSASESAVQPFGPMQLTSRKVVLRALDAMALVTEEPTNRNVIIQDGGLDTLYKNCASNDLMVAERAMQVIGLLACGTSKKEKATTFTTYSDLEKRDNAGDPNSLPTVGIDRFENDFCQEAIHQKRGLRTIFPLLLSQCKELQRTTAQVIANLSSNTNNVRDANALRWSQMNSLAPVYDLCSAKDPIMAVRAMKALGHFALVRPSCMVESSIQNVFDTTVPLDSPHPEWASVFLPLESDPHHTILDTGGLSVLATALLDADDSVKLEALRVVANLGLLHVRLRRAIVKHPALFPQIVKFLDSEKDDANEETAILGLSRLMVELVETLSCRVEHRLECACTAIGHLALVHTSPEYRNRFLELGARSLVEEVISSGLAGRQAVHALGGLSEGSWTPIFNLCSSPDLFVAERATQALAELVLDSECQRAVFENNALDVLVPLLHSKSDTVQEGAVLVIANLGMTYQDIRKAILHKDGILPRLVEFLGSTKEVCESELSAAESTAESIECTPIHHTALLVFSRTVESLVGLLTDEAVAAYLVPFGRGVSVQVIL